MEEFDSLFEQHYIKNYNKLYNVAYRLTGNSHDAEDVLQEAFINAYKAFPDFNGKSLFTTWMFRILINCSRKYIKKRKMLPAEKIALNHNSTEEDIINNLKTADTVVDEVATANLREFCLQMFLNCMPLKQRVAFTLKVMLDLSVHETALIMGISESAVKTNIFRARRLMKENMEGRCSLINPKNKCECRLWAKYAADNGLVKNISQYSPHEGTTVKVKFDEFINEISLMSKLITIYKNQTWVTNNIDEFIEKMRKIIRQKNMKFLI